jgi:hypothetical protein
MKITLSDTPLLSTQQIGELATRIADKNAGSAGGRDPIDLAGHNEPFHGRQQGHQMDVRHRQTLRQHALRLIGTKLHVAKPTSRGRLA